MKFKKVENCGKRRRTITRIDDICIAGCFRGTRSEIEERIRNEYTGKACSDYLAKIDILFSGGCDITNIKYWDNYVKCEVARQHKHSKELSCDSDRNVRAAVAMAGDCHDVLYSDSDWYVRACVARAGSYGDVLKDDKILAVRDAVEAYEKENKKK